MKIRLFCVVLFLFSFNCIAKDKAKPKISPEELKLQSNFIGDNEQPLVSYFVPWKGVSSSPDKLEWKLDSKFDKTLNLVDRNILMRTNAIYNTMSFEPKKK